MFNGRIMYDFQVINLNTQLIYFKNMERLLRQKLGDEDAKKILFEAVYLISIGSNDYLSPYSTGSSVLQSYPLKTYRHMVIGNLTVVIEVIASFIFEKPIFLLDTLENSGFGISLIVDLFFRKYTRREEGNLGFLPWGR